MMLEHLFNSSFLYSLSLTLLHFLWQGLLVAFVLKSALLIISNKKPQLRYVLATLAMLTNFILPLVTFGIIYRAELAYPGTATSVLTLTDLIHELKQPDAFFSIQELSELLPAFLPYIALFWFATVILLASKLLVEIYHVNKLPQQGSIEPDAQLLLRFNELAKQINVSIYPKLLISLKVDVPMAIGWLKPVVLIPATMISGLSSAQLEMLILHELAHIRRHDYLVNFIQTFVEILLFFHPAVLWVSKQMRNEREYCSDDIAVQHCGDAIAYAHTLADTASLCTKNHQHHTIPSMAMAASGGDLKQRVIRLVDHHCAPQNNISKWLASATIIFSILLLSSKQLLTMPLLDIWHNEIPFKSSNSSYKNAYQVNNLLTDINERFSDDKLPKTSIAKELLTPQSTSKNQHTPLTQSTVELTQIVTSGAKSLSTVQTQNAALTSDTPIRKQKIITHEQNAYSTQINTLSLTQHKPVETIQSNSNAITTSSMVEQAFEKTDSNKQHSAMTNPYAQQLAQLAASDAKVVQSATSQAIRQQKQISNLLAQKNIATYGYIEHDQPSKNTARFITTQNDLPLSTSSHKQSQQEELTLAPVWHNAKQLKSVSPIYPSVAKRKGIELEIKVDFTIDVNGHIKNIQFARQHKINYFKNSIRSAIKQWRFSPAKVDEKPVESQMSKVFAFSLQS